MLRPRALGLVLCLLAACDEPARVDDVRTAALGEEVQLGEGERGRVRIDGVDIRFAGTTFAESEAGCFARARFVVREAGRPDEEVSVAEGHEARVAGHALEVRRTTPEGRPVLVVRRAR